MIKSTGSPSVSVVIPTYNKAANLDLTLAGLVQQTHHAFEVVVHDDGSQDATPAVVERYKGRLNLVYSRGENGGRSRARNAGIERASGELIILVDDDRIAASQFVAAHLESYVEGGSRRLTLGAQRGILSRWFPEVDLSAHRLMAVLRRCPELLPRLGKEPTDLITTSMIERDLTSTLARLECSDPWWEDFIEKLVLPNFGVDLRDFEFPYFIASTGNMSVRRDLAIEVGLFDTSFKGWGLEDVDFQYRLHRAGTDARVVEAAVNYHQLHARPKVLMQEWVKNALYLLDKYDDLAIVFLMGVIGERMTLVEANDIVRASKHGGDDGIARKHFTRALRAELRARWRVWSDS